MKAGALPFIKVENQKLQPKSINTNPTGMSGLTYGYHQARDDETKQNKTTTIGTLDIHGKP
jgi:hypothetical protein